MNRKSVVMSYSTMPVLKLAVHVMEIQHPYLEKSLATFLACSKTLNDTPGMEPGSKMLGTSLEKLGALIKKHLEHEELELFPYLRARITDQPDQEPPLFLRKMKAEHHSISMLFDKVRMLSNDYTPALQASAGTKLCYARLFNFEQDMLKHIFLEEDILFPKLLKG